MGVGEVYYVHGFCFRLRLVATTSQTRVVTSSVGAMGGA